MPRVLQNWTGSVCLSLEIYKFWKCSDGSFVAGQRCGSSKQEYTGLPTSQWIESSEDLEKHISSTCPLCFLIIYASDASDASAIALLPDDHHGQPRIGRDSVPKLSPKASIVYFSFILSLWSEYQGSQLHRHNCQRCTGRGGGHA